MRIRLKLSVSHDMDLIALSQSQFPMIEWLRICLKVYVEEGRIVSIPLPSAPQSIRCDKLSINFSLNETKDQSVINWLCKIRSGQRSGAIKSIFRCCLSAPYLYGHFEETNGAVPYISRKQNAAVNLYEHQPSSTIKETTPPACKNESISLTDQKRESDDDDFDILDFDPENF